MPRSARPQAALDRRLPVEENLRFFADLQGLPVSEAGARVEEALRAVMLDGLSLADGTVLRDLAALVGFALASALAAMATIGGRRPDPALTSPFG